MYGTLEYPLVERVRDDIACFGLHETVLLHWKKWGKRDKVTFRAIFRAAWLAEA